MRSMVCLSIRSAWWFKLMLMFIFEVVVNNNSCTDISSTLTLREERRSTYVLAIERETQSKRDVSSWIANYSTELSILCVYFCLLCTHRHSRSHHCDEDMAQHKQHCCIVYEFIIPLDSFYAVQHASSSIQHTNNDATRQYGNKSEGYCRSRYSPTQ